MRVLHILNELHYSGAEVMLHDAKECFARAGIHTTVLATGEELGPYAETLKGCGYTVEHIPFAKDLSYFGRLYRFVRNGDFDAIHIWPERAYSYHALVARLGSRGVIVRTYCDVFVHYGWYKRVVRRVQRLAARTLFAVKGIAIGDSVQQVELQFFGNPCEIVYDWIDEKAFRPPAQLEREESRKAFGASAQDVVFCVVGSCNEKKRHRDILAALAKVRQETPSVRLLHRGTGPHTEQEGAYALELGIDDAVAFIGYLESLAPLYWASDCFVFASKWEGLGDVIIEAIACGLPVILYDGWGMRDFRPVADQNYGYWCGVETDGLAEAMQDFTRKTLDERLQMSRNAQKFFRAKFSRERSLGRLISIYRGA